MEAAASAQEAGARGAGAAAVASPRLGHPSPRNAAKAERKRAKNAAAAAAAAPPTVPEATAVTIASVAEVPAEAAATAPPLPTSVVINSPRSVIIDIHRQDSARASAAGSELSSDASGLSPRADGGNVEGEGDSSASASASASSGPLSRLRTFARVLTIPFIQLAIWLSHLWALLAGALLVAPLRLVRAPGGALRRARAIAQRPLLLLSVALAAPVYLDDVSYGVDFQALPGQRAATMHDLIGQVRPGAAGSSGAAGPAHACALFSLVLAFF
jgi:hypothetical protein